MQSKSYESWVEEKSLIRKTTQLERGKYHQKKKFHRYFHEPRLCVRPGSPRFVIVAFTAISGDVKLQQNSGSAKSKQKIYLSGYEKLIWEWGGSKIRFELNSREMFTNCNHSTIIRTDFGDIFVIMDFEFDYANMNILTFGAEIS